MLNLFEKLTAEDKETFSAFVEKYNGAKKYCGNDKYLREWAKNKKRLYHLLGGNIIYSFPFEYDEPEEEISRQITEYITTGTNSFLWHLHEKIKKIIEADLSKYPDGIHFSSVIFRILYNYNTLVITQPTLKCVIDGKRLQIQSGMKWTKAVRKIIDFFKLNSAEVNAEFDKILIELSKITNTAHFKGKLCISIHPLDYLTMSDNDYRWSSCMSWRKDGCYRAGTVEMMNSNNVLCCYLTSDNDNNDKMDFGCGKWNNKKWRQLFVYTNDIAVGGKAYPYQNDDLTTAILNKLYELTEVNLKRTFEFGIEPYRDMCHIGSLYRMNKNREWIADGVSKKKNIIFDTKLMYNDFLNDHDLFDVLTPSYLCYRNKVKKSKIVNISGKMLCSCCGKEIERVEVNTFDYNDRFFKTRPVICAECN